MINTGYTRVNIPYREKFYVSYIGRNFLKRRHKTATQAKEYAEKVNRRYERLRKCATGS